MNDELKKEPDPEPEPEPEPELRVSVDIPRETNNKLYDLAKAWGISKAAVSRKALISYAEIHTRSL